MSKAKEENPILRKLGPKQCMELLLEVGIAAQKKTVVVGDYNPEN